MKTPKNPKAPHAYFDCDGTLVLWRDDFKGEFPQDKTLPFNHEGTIYNLVPNETVIQALKNRHKAGQTIVVWSRGGAVWANVVVTKLDLNDYVEFCISKPDLFWDDEKASQFMDETIRKKPKNPYE